MEEKNYPQGKLKVKESKSGNKYFSGWFKLDEKLYFLNVTRSREDYSVWIQEAPARESSEVSKEQSDNIPF